MTYMLKLMAVASTTCIVQFPPQQTCTIHAGYVVVTDEATGRTIPNAFLDKLKEEFISKYAEKGKTVPELGLSNFG